MRNSHLYAWIVFCLVFVPASLLSLSAIPFAAYNGPLTRIGGFSEEDFGWQEPQDVYLTPQFTWAHSAADYDRYYDVVVFGDSFSIDLKKGWQNHFVEQTGLSVITFHHNVSLDSVLNSKMFELHPPRFFVFESLEQYSLNRLLSYQVYQGSSKYKDVVKPQHELFFVKREQQKKKITNVSDASYEERIGQRRHNLEKEMARLIYGDGLLEQRIKQHQKGVYEYTEDTYLLKLKRGERLFSNRRSDNLLIYSLDIFKAVSSELLANASQGADRLRAKIEQNGLTRFVLMLFPDKLSVYTPWLADSSIAPPSLIPELALLYPSQVRLDLAFRRALEKPVVDLYLPNDTHTGCEGYRIAAQTLTNYLIANGMAKYH